MKHFWGSLLLGAVLLGGLVAFALLPGAGGDEPEVSVPADAVAALDTTQSACRTFRVGRAQAGLDRALSNLSQALQFEKTPGDHMSFYDWIEADTVSRSLLEIWPAGRSNMRLAKTAPAMAPTVCAVA